MDNSTEGFFLSTGDEKIINNDTREIISFSENSTVEIKSRRHRRCAKEIQAEYELFKEYFDQGIPVLEISRKMGIKKSQCDRHLSKISLEKNHHDLKYGVCEGHCLPESIRNLLNGSKTSLYKFELIEGRVHIYMAIE